MKKISTSVAILVVLVLFVFSGFVLGGLYVFEKHKEAQAKLDGLETRYSRMLGLKLSQSQLESGVLASQALIEQYAYPGSQDATQVANDAQQRVRALFVGAGLDVVSIQALPPKQEKGLEMVPVVVRFEGQLSGVQSAMVVLAGQKPKVFVESFTLQTIGLVKAELQQRLGGQFNMYVLRVRS